MVEKAGGRIDEGGGRSVRGSGEEGDMQEMT
jgi:hypothetical protein